MHAIMCRSTKSHDDTHLQISFFIKFHPSLTFLPFVHFQIAEASHFALIHRALSSR